MSNDEQLRYPIGRHVSKDHYSPEEIHQFIQRIEEVPAQIESVVKTLSLLQLSTPYRSGGWTALQVIHHIPDSHMNAYIRVKWTLTEETPSIKPYDEKAWVTTPEVSGDPFLSIDVLKSLHKKWGVLLRGLSPADLQRQFFHPDAKKHIRLDQALASYAWHGEHHLGHLKIVAAK
jgi:hypothetical protein